MAKDKQENKTADISKSKAKREERKKEVAKDRRQKRISKILSIAAAAALAAVVIIAAGKMVYLSALRTTSISDPSAGLTADGKIEGFDAGKSLTLADYANISVPADEVAATDEEVDADIQSTLEAHKEANTDAALEIQDGDEVNIDYVGTVDGVEFEGGNSNGEGYDLTIGSGLFIDDFEQQLIGHKPGENVSVEVTFPDDYDGEEVAGKDAVFAVTINSISVTPELTDEFVAENITEEGVTTAEEYRTFVKNKFYEQHLEEYLTNYIVDNTTVKSYPSDYLKKVRDTTIANDESMLQYFSSYGMTNVWDIRDDDIKDELSYEKELRTRAKETAKSAMVYQAIFEDAGLTLDMEAAYAEMTEENGEDYVTNMKENYGEAYLAQGEIREAVTDYLMDLYK